MVYPLRKLLCLDLCRFMFYFAIDEGIYVLLGFLNLAGESCWGKRRILLDICCHSGTCGKLLIIALSINFFWNSVYRLWPSHELFLSTQIDIILRKNDGKEKLSFYVCSAELILIIFNSNNLLYSLWWPVFLKVFRMFFFETSI